MSEQVKVAVVGCGYWGPNLVRNFHQLPTADLVSCCDIDPQKLDKIKALYPTVRTTVSYADILANGEIEAVALLD